MEDRAGRSSAGRRGRRGGPPRSEHPERLGTVLEAIRGDRPWASGLLLGELGRRWAQVVGDRLAVETSPAALDSGVLVVKASSAAWAAQVRFLGEEIRGRANEALGGAVVEQVKVTVDGGPDRP